MVSDVLVQRLSGRAGQTAVPGLKVRHNVLGAFLRGGAWNMDAFRCRSSYRSFDHRDTQDGGFDCE